jgi:subtilisin
LRRAAVVMSVVAALVTATGTVAQADPLPTTQPTPQPYVVILKDGSTATQIAQDATKNGVEPTMTYTTAVSGYAGVLSAASQKSVKSDPNVLIAAPDETFTSTRAVRSSHRLGHGSWGYSQRHSDNCNTGNGDLGDGTSPDTTDAYPPATTFQQFIPTNLERVGLACSPSAGISGGGPNVNASIAVLDSGIQAGNPELNLVGGVNCSDEAGSSYGDDFGHGSAVGGVAAAIDNRFGVVGAAPGARLYSVKVLDQNDDGDFAQIICGVDWVMAHHKQIDVANMSLEGPGADDHDCGLKNNDPLHYAICRAVDVGGVTFVVAAGNDGVNTKDIIPAAYSEVITVAGFSDTDGLPGGKGPVCDGYNDNAFAPFSNYGSDVDLMAIATCITTTYNDGTLVFWDGTSFAAPAVAGAAADLIAHHPQMTPAQVKQSLQAHAEYGLPGSRGVGLLNMRGQ